MSRLSNGELYERPLLDVDPEDSGQETVWLVIKKDDARRLVREIERGAPFKCVEIIKQQPWWPDLSHQIRQGEQNDFHPYAHITVSAS